METHIDALPEEMLVKIFSWLGRKDKASCSKVCKYWEAVGKIVSLWKDEEAQVDLDTVSTDVLRNLGEREVGGVCVTRCSEQGALKNLFLTHPNISRLDIEFCDEDPPLNIANEFSVRLPRLKTLTIHLRSKDSAVQFMDISCLHFPQVENLTLNLVGCGFTLKDLCQNLNRRLRNLKKLAVNTWYYLGPRNLLPGCDLPDPESHIEHLKACCADDISCPTWDWFYHSFPSLKRLQLYVSQLSDFSQLSFLSRLPELQTLRVMCEVEDKGVSQPGFCCTSILRLSISLIGEVEEDDMVKLICQCFPSLKKLELIYRMFSYEAIMKLAKNLPQLEKVRMPAHSRSLQRRLEEQGLGHLLDTSQPARTIVKGKKKDNCQDKF